MDALLGKIECQEQRVAHRLTKARSEWPWLTDAGIADRLALSYGGLFSGIVVELRDVNPLLSREAHGLLGSGRESREDEE
jgi:hypothetical protein